MNEERLTMNQKRSTNNENGVALILALGVLALVLVMALSFAFQARTEREASAVRSDITKARLLCESGLERAMAYLQHDNRWIVEEGDAESPFSVDSLTDDDKAWSADEHNNRMVIITAGTGAGQIREISDTTTGPSTLHLDTPPDLDPTPATDSIYIIVEGNHLFPSTKSASISNFEFKQPSGTDWHGRRFAVSRASGNELDQHGIAEALGTEQGDLTFLATRTDPEIFSDDDGDGERDSTENYQDLNNDGSYDGSLASSSELGSGVSWQHIKNNAGEIVGRIAFIIVNESGKVNPNAVVTRHEPFVNLNGDLIDKNMYSDRGVPDYDTDEPYSDVGDLGSYNHGEPFSDRDDDYNYDSNEDYADLNEDGNYTAQQIDEGDEVKRGVSPQEIDLSELFSAAGVSVSWEDFYYRIPYANDNDISSLGSFSEEGDLKPMEWSSWNHIFATLQPYGMGQGDFDALSDAVFPRSKTLEAWWSDGKYRHRFDLSGIEWNRIADEFTEDYDDTDGKWSCEPYIDQNNNGYYDVGEPYTDVNDNGTWDCDSTQKTPNAQWEWDSGGSQGWDNHLYAVPEIDTGNSSDDDGDGVVDDSSSDAAGSAESDVTNGMDDDGDGIADDYDRARRIGWLQSKAKNFWQYAHPKATPEIYTSNNFDDDGDGVQDDGPGVPAGSAESDLTNEVDDDNDGVVDDDEYVYASPEPPLKRNNGRDDDGDGVVDDGPGDPAGRSEAPKNLGNDVDDDGDGIVDDSQKRSEKITKPAKPGDGIGGIPWLGQLEATTDVNADGNPPSMTTDDGTDGNSIPEDIEDDNLLQKQVTANLMDYCDSDSWATNDWTDESSVNWGKPVEPDPSDPDYNPMDHAQFVGVEKVPYINEVGYSLEYTNDSGNADTRTLVIDVHPEVANIYAANISDYDIRVQVELDLPTAANNFQITDDTDPTESGFYGCTFEWEWGTDITNDLGSNSYRDEGGMSISYSWDDGTDPNVKVKRVAVTLWENGSTSSDHLLDFCRVNTDSPEVSLADPGEGVSHYYEISVEADDPRCNTADAFWYWASGWDDSSSSTLTVGTLGIKNQNVDPSNNGVDPSDASQFYGTSVPDKHDAETITDPKNGISTAYIRNAPPKSLWELGAIHRGEPWRTLNLTAFNDSSSDETYENGDAVMLGQVKLKPYDFRKTGKFNANSASEEAWQGLLSRITVGGDYDSPGSGTPLTNTDASNIVTNTTGIFDINATHATTYKPLANRGGLAKSDTLFDGTGGPSQDTDRKKEEILGKIANLLTVRPNYFTIIVCAQAIKDVEGITYKWGERYEDQDGDGTHDSGEPFVDWDGDGDWEVHTRTAQLGQFDVGYELGEYDPGDPNHNSDVKYIDPILAEQKIKAVVYRDSFTNKLRVLRYEYLED